MWVARLLTAVFVLALSSEALRSPQAHGLKRSRAPGVWTAQGDDFITSIFQRFLPTPKDVGLTQFTSKTLPEKFPAVKNEWAELLPSDNDDDKKLVRQTLKNTNLETRPLVLAYDANRDGWRADAFHSKVDRKGPCVVLCRTKSGGLFGGYNPCGWVNLGESRGCIAAFLFYFPQGNKQERPVKLQKIGGASMAQLDDGAIKFGAEGLTIPLGALGKSVSSRIVRSKLGLYYENGPGGLRSVLPAGKPEDELDSLLIYRGDFGSDPVPYNDVMFFQLN